MGLIIIIIIIIIIIVAAATAAREIALGWSLSGRLVCRIFY
ncbi:MAG: hypothetical protein N7Q72_03155 [Spiroplasma sp. Tabriz.8]|nr:hypothetical protein [Spiroplasma sp. Tabriz.8]